MKAFVGAPSGWDELAAWQLGVGKSRQIRPGCLSRERVEALAWNVSVIHRTSALAGLFEEDHDWTVHLGAEC